MLPCSSYLPLGVPNGSLLGEHQADFLAPLPGRRSTSTRGVSHSQPFYFVIALLILFLFAFLYRKYKKNSYSFYSSCFICLPCYIKKQNKNSHSFYSCCLVLLMLKWVLLLKIPSCVTLLAPTTMILFPHLLLHLLLRQIL